MAQFKSLKTIAIIGVALLLLMNYSVVFFGINGDFFGIMASVVLFFAGGRPTNFKVSYLLLGMILVFEFVSFRLHVKSLHFLSLMLMVCLVYNAFTGKFSFIAFISLLLFSTIFNKLFEHLTIEIKQSLCQAVYVTLKDFIPIDRIEGVNFYIDEKRITIDTACMGLSMFKTGLLTGAILLTLEEKKTQRHFNILQIIAFCAIIVLLNLLSNYFRIVTLILMDVTEENFLHHAIGLVCFVLYQVLPMLILMRYFKPKIISITSCKSLPNKVFIWGVFVIVFVTSLEMLTPQKTMLLDNLDPKYKVATGNWVNDEVFKIQEGDKLVYIKTPSHKPLICWTGDGYLITHSTQIVRENAKVWLHHMERNGVHYETVWWYESGNQKYTSFLEVMMVRLIYNKPIRLINETRKID